MAEIRFHRLRCGRKKSSRWMRDLTFSCQIGLYFVLKLENEIMNSHLQMMRKNLESTQNISRSEKKRLNKARRKCSDVKE